MQSLFKSSSLVLGPTALEVMAIIAYRQPISRTEIDQIRGVDSSHILRILMDKRLVQVCGRSKDVGKPVVYGTTKEFLEMFNISSLQDLPPEHELNALADNQDLGDISDIKELVSSSVELHDKFNFDEIDELDELAKVIKEVSPDTAFTKSIQAEEKKRQDPEATTQSAFELLEEFVKSADARTPDSNDEPTVKAPAAPALATPPMPKELAQATDIGASAEADELEAQLDRAFAKLTAAHSAGEETDSTGPEDDLAREKISPTTFPKAMIWGTPVVGATLGETMNSPPTIRLHKYIADCGITSRRKAEGLISRGASCPQWQDHHQAGGQTQSHLRYRLRGG